MKVWYIASSGKIGADKSITTQLNGRKNIMGTISSKENINLNIGEIDSELGNITSLGDINIKSNTPVNEVRSTIWAGTDIYSLKL